MRSIRETKLRFSPLLVCLSLALMACPSAPQAPRQRGAGRSYPQRGGTFSFSHESNVRTLDPHLAFDELSMAAIRLLFDGLLDYDAEARLIPSIAQRLPEVLDGGRRYIFEIRRGVRFHHGRELEAEDIAWSIRRMLDPKIGSPGFTFFKNLEGLEDFRAGRRKTIAGIRVLAPHRIEFRLHRADQTFLNALAMSFAYPLPKEIYGVRPLAELARHPVGTGPFRLQSWERGVRLIFHRNPNYWREGKPYVDRMVFYENISRDIAVMRFRNGELDHLGAFSPTDYVFFKNSKAWQPYLSEAPEATIWGLAMNCQLFPFDNVHIRRAVSYALDRERWARVRNGRIRVTGQPIPPGIVGYRASFPEQQGFDLAKAREEMALAGYPDGLPQEVTLWMGEGASSRFFGELTQADLAKIGIRVRLKPVAFAVFLQETGKPKTAQMLMSGWAQDFPDPADFLDILFHSSAIHPSDSENRAFYSNPTLDRLLDEARGEIDAERRRRLYEEASRIVSVDAPWAFLWNGIDFNARQPFVRGFRQHPVWKGDYRFVWLDRPLRKF